MASSSGTGAAEEEGGAVSGVGPMIVPLSSSPAESGTEHDTECEIHSGAVGFDGVACLCAERTADLHVAAPRECYICHKPEDGPGALHCSRPHGELPVAAPARPEKVGDRVVCPDGATGYVAMSHPEIPGAVFVQLDEMRVYMREELRLDV